VAEDRDEEDKGCRDRSREPHGANRMARTIFALLRDGAMDRPRVSATPPGQRRQGQEPGADIAQDGGGLGAFVAGEVVEEDRVARLQERWFV